MIAAEYVVVNLGGGDFIAESVGNDKVVDAPACVFGASLEHIAPPGVFYGIGMHITEGVLSSAPKGKGGLPTFFGTLY